MEEIRRSPPGMYQTRRKSWDKLPINWCRISSINYFEMKFAWGYLVYKTLFDIDINLITDPR